MVKVAKIEDSKNPEWVVVTLENVVDEEDAKFLRSKGWDDSGKKAWYVFKKDVNEFKVGDVLNTRIIVTRSSETPFYEGQEPYEVKDKEGNVLSNLYYRNEMIKKSDLQ